jgi:hypothetical protein
MTLRLFVPMEVRRVFKMETYEGKNGADFDLTLN